MLRKSEILKVRGLLMTHGITGKTIAEKFDISQTAGHCSITGAMRSDKIQKYISEQIGYWPYPWKLGVKRSLQV